MQLSGYFHDGVGDRTDELGPPCPDCGWEQIFIQSMTNPSSPGRYVCDYAYERGVHFSPQDLCIVLPRTDPGTFKRTQAHGRAEVRYPETK